jgi:hypothetical protein
MLVKLFSLAALSVQLTYSNITFSKDTSWSHYRNERFGFSYKYPAERFQPAPVAGPDGMALNPGVMKLLNPQMTKAPQKPKSQNEQQEPGEVTLIEPEKPALKSMEKDQSEATAAIQGAPLIVKEGTVLVATGGEGKLSVSGTYNAEKLTMQKYRARMLRESWAGMKLDYEYGGRTFFVLAGRKDGNLHFHKTMFSCGGRIINSLHVSYPEKEAAGYNLLLPRLEKHFRTSPGEGCPLPVKKVTRIKVRPVDDEF